MSWEQSQGNQGGNAGASGPYDLGGLFVRVYSERRGAVSQWTTGSDLHSEERALDFGRPRSRPAWWGPRIQTPNQASSLRFGRFLDDEMGEGKDVGPVQGRKADIVGKSTGRGRVGRAAEAWAALPPGKGPPDSYAVLFRLSVQSLPDAGEERGN